jgi:hypothetical protein
MRAATAVRAKDNGVFNRIVAVIGQRYLVMYLRIRFAVSQFYKRCTPLAVPHLRAVCSSTSATTSALRLNAEALTVARGFLGRTDQASFPLRWTR